MGSPLSCLFVCITKSLFAWKIYYVCFQTAKRPLKNKPQSSILMRTWLPNTPLWFQMALCQPSKMLPEAQSFKKREREKKKKSGYRPLSEGSFVSWMASKKELYRRTWVIGVCSWTKLSSCFEKFERKKEGRATLKLVHDVLKSVFLAPKKAPLPLYPALPIPSTCLLHTHLLFL